MMSLVVSVLINGNSLNLNTDLYNVKYLGWGNKTINFLDNILDISITKNLVIVTTEDPDFQNGAQIIPWVKDHEITNNNINAYDWNGNHIWNIAEIVGNIKMCFCAGHVNSVKDFKDYYGFMESKYNKEHDFFSCTTYAHLYVIDLTERKLVQRLDIK